MPLFLVNLITPLSNATDISVPLAFILPLALVIVFFLFIVVWMRTQNRKWASPYRDLLARVPGQSLSVEIEKLQEDVTLDFFAIFVFLFLWTLLVLKSLTIANILSPFLSLLMAAWMIRTFVTISRLKRFQLSRKGELLTGQYLQELLKDGYQIFHDVGMDGVHVDHVVVGANGVFAVETNTQRKPKKWGPEKAKVVYDDRGLTFIGQKPSERALTEAVDRAKSLQNWLSKAIGEAVRVAPVVALPGWFVEQKRKVALVPVLNPKRLRTYITEYGTQCLWEEQLVRICLQLGEKSNNETLKEMGARS